MEWYTLQLVTWAQNESIFSIEKQDTFVFVSPTGKSGVAVAVVGVVAVLFLLAAVITVIAVLLRYTQPEKGDM